MEEQKYNEHVARYKRYNNSHDFMYKYWFIKDNLFKSYNDNKELIEYILHNDLKFLFALYTLHGAHKFYDLENWQNEKKIKECWSILINNFTKGKYSEDIINDFSEKITKKIMSLSHEEINNIKISSDNILKKNYKDFKADDDRHTLYKGFFYNKDIELEHKEMLYDDILKSKSFGFNFASSIKQTPQMLTFHKIFDFLSKEDLEKIFDLSKEVNENKKVDLLNIIKEVFKISSYEDKIRIKKKLLSIKNDNYTYLFDELEKEQCYQEIEIINEDYKTIANKLGQYIKNNNDYSIEFIEVMTDYVESLNEKYGLGLKINTFLDDLDLNNKMTFGCFVEKTDSISLNFEYLSSYHPHIWGVIKMINTIHHELIHAIQFKKEFHQKNDYETLVQIIDSYAYLDVYDMNYWNISFEYDARARAYIETQRFIYENCPEFKNRLSYLQEDDLDKIKKRIRKRKFSQKDNPSFFLPAIFLIANNDLEEKLELDKYPVLNKVFYRDKKDNKIKMYNELYFRNKLLQAKFNGNKEEYDFYKNIILDFDINKYLRKNPFLQENELNLLDRFNKRVR